VTRRRAEAGIAVSVLAAILVATTGGADPQTRIAAHRGGAPRWRPRNSMTAFRGAIALGADALEFDAHFTADREPVVIHDAALERTTTGRGAVGDATLSLLRALPMKARDGSVTTDTVPTLAKVLDLAAPTKAEVLPEIKTAGGGRRYAGIEEKVLALLRARRFGERATIQAFDEATTGLSAPARDRARGAAGGCALGERGRRQRRRHGLPDDARVIAAVRAARVRLSAWTVSAGADLRRLLDLGVDVVMSDHLDLALSRAGHPLRKP
jgi:glycerophosphoryl diester phosphodiesterase